MKLPRPRSLGERHHAVRRHLLPDRQRHAREADRHQGAPATAKSIFDGNGNFNLFNVKAADYNYFEGLTIRNTDIAIWAGTQFIAGSKGLTVKNCRFENVGIGVFTNYSGSSNFYIADNYFIGRDDPNHLIGWNGDVLGAVRRRRRPEVPAGDGVVHRPSSSTARATSSPTTTSPISTTASTSRRTAIRTARTRSTGRTIRRGSIGIGGRSSIDFYNNYMTNFHDNAFEIDGSMHNVRVMRNMMINSASHPFCNQPAIGGPVYWIRNIAYHAPGGSTRLTNGSAGVLFYNNTILTETTAASARNVHWRNNLMLGENSAPAIFSVNTNTNYSSVRLQRLPAESRSRSVRSSGTHRRGRRAPTIAACGATAAARGAGHRAGPARRRAVRDRSPSTARRRSRISTASRSTTTSS